MNTLSITISSAPLITFLVLLSTAAVILIIWGLRSAPPKPVAPVRSITRPPAPRSTDLVITPSNTDTARPFSHFTDSDGHSCSLQASSIILNYKGAVENPGTSAVWLGLDHREKMHLNRDQLRGLILRMQEWLDKGRWEE